MASRAVIASGRADETTLLEAVRECVTERGAFEVTTTTSRLWLVVEMWERPAIGDVAFGVAIQGSPPAVSCKGDLSAALGDADVVERIVSCGTIIYLDKAEVASRKYHLRRTLVHLFPNLSLRFGAEIELELTCGGRRIESYA